MRLYLVRHGQTAWNAELKAQGHSDIELDELGEAQARLLGSGFTGTPLGLVLSSDLKRAAYTAQPIAEATGAKFQMLSEVREQSFGDWEGRSFVEINLGFEEMEKELGLERLHLCPPNGESATDVWRRLEPVAERLQSFQDDVAVVTHGGTCSLLLAKLLRGSIETSRAFRFHNTAITELFRRPDGLFELVRYNDTAHLMAGIALGGSIDGATR